jgi:hypothetical protein
MIEPKTTKTYDLHLCYDSGYDDQPRVYARQMWLDRDGLWNTDDDDYDTYYYTEEETNWTIEKFELGDITHLYFDEWFTTEDRHLMLNNLPPKALAWAESLPAYEYYTEAKLEEASV